jgi:hypothetical protein
MNYESMNVCRMEEFVPKNIVYKQTYILYCCMLNYLDSLVLITSIPSQDGQVCSFYELLLKATTTLSTNKEPRVSSSVVEPHLTPHPLIPSY